MALSPRLISARTARLRLLEEQGLLEDERSATPRSVLEMIERLGFVQVDSINVVERAHHLTLCSRFVGYRPALLDRLLERRKLFEHWTHDASIIPIDWFPHWRHRFERFRSRLKNRWLRQRIGSHPERVIARVRARIARDGPLMSKDFEDSAPRARLEEGWWSWKAEKAALEFLWWTGELAIVRRSGFQKVYDLTERVYPEHARQPPSEPDAHRDWACRGALERLGFASPTEMAAFWRAVSIAEARTWCAEAEARGEIEPVEIEGADGSRPHKAYGLVDRARRRSREAPSSMRLLCPFDPVLRDRRRAQRLFDFDYRFEAFVPKHARTYGYYVMPVLEGDRLVARVDPKLHRDRSLLEIRRVSWEKGVRPTKARRRALEGAVERLATLVGADTCIVVK
jgi:uncharacterized protein YcaQ